MKRACLSAGIAAPFLYLLVVLAGGALTPDYSHLHQPVSALFEAGAALAVPISLTFVGYNLLLLVFGVGLLLDQRRARPALRLGAIMILLNGLLGVIIELTPMDAQGAAMSPAGFAHMVIAGLLVLTCMAAMAVMAWGWRRDGEKGGLVAISVGLLAFMLVAGALAALAAGNAWPFMGLYQRLTIGAYLVWILALALDALGARRTAQAV